MARGMGAAQRKIWDCARSCLKILTRHIDLILNSRRQRRAADMFIGSIADLFRFQVPQALRILNQQAVSLSTQIVS